MGISASKAQEELGAEKASLAGVVKVLENKLAEFESRLENARLSSMATPSSTEVIGGRSLMTVSEIRVTTSGGPDKQIQAGVADFFAAAQGGAADNNAAAKAAAINGASKLVAAGLDALFGVRNGQSMEKKSFFVLYMNFAFVRVDYNFYSYSASAKKWGAEASESGCCYLASLAVLDPAKLHPQEIDFLLSRAMSASTPEDTRSLLQLKLKLVESTILSQQIRKENITFKELQTITGELLECHNKIDAIFSTLTPSDVVAEKSAFFSASAPGGSSSSKNILAPPASKLAVPSPSTPASVPVTMVMKA